MNPDTDDPTIEAIDIGAPQPDPDPGDIEDAIDNLEADANNAYIEEDAA